MQCVVGWKVAGGGWVKGGLREGELPAGGIHASQGTFSSLGYFSIYDRLKFHAQLS